MEDIFLIDEKVTLEVATIEQIVDRMIEDTSKFIIPEYQRDYVWKDKSVPLLLLSLYKSYPIGTMLLQQTKTGKTKLLDGLQRTFSLVKISEKPLNYLSKELIQYYFDRVIKLDIPASRVDLVWDKINENIKEHAKTGQILTSQRIYGLLDDKSETKELLKDFLSSFEDWFDNEFKKIKVPQIKLTSEIKDSDSAEIFELINSQGKSLNKFEVLSSYWSNYPINVPNIVFIENFINTRISNFLKTINSTDKTKIEMDTKSVSPANFIYSVFDKAASDNPSIKYIYYNGDSLRTKAIEPITSIFANYLGLDKLNSTSLKQIGPLLQERIKSEEDVNKLAELISRSMSKLADSLYIFSYLSSKGQNKNIFNVMGISISMITAQLNQILSMEMNGKSFNSKIDGKHFLNWILIDTISGEYDTGSNSRAWSNFKSGKYLNEPKQNILNVIQNHIISEAGDSTVKTSVSSSTILILSIIQHKFTREDTTSLDLDHVIPKSLFSSRNVRKNYINTIGNLQLLSSEINRELKRDLISPEDDQWDFIIKNQIRISEQDKKEHKHLLYLMKENYYKLDVNKKILTKKHTLAKTRIEKAETKQKINVTLFEEFYEIRLRVIMDLIKKTFGGDNDR